MFREIENTLNNNKLVDVNTGCWLWTACKTENGYGRVRYNGHLVLVHRLSLHIYKNFDLDSQLQVCHNCPGGDNKACFNPEHLHVLDAAMHRRETQEKGQYSYARSEHCRNGHEFTAANTYVYSGYRYCLTCRHNWRERRREGKTKR